MSVGFYLKKLLGTVLMPLPVITVLLVVAVVLLWFTRRQVLGKVVVTVAVFLLYVLSLPFIPYAAIMSIERPVDSVIIPPDSAALAEVKWIVVLSGGSPGQPGYSSVNRVGGPTLARLVEGIRVWRQIPEAKLVVSGGDWEGGTPSAEVMRDVAVDLGVPETHIIVDGAAADTEDSAAFASRMVGDDRLALVTSASHMPRALLHFQQRGLRPVPIRAPFSYTIPPEQTIFSYSPVPGNLTASTTAWYEFLGRVWSRMGRN